MSARAHLWRAGRLVAASLGLALLAACGEGIPSVPREGDVRASLPVPHAPPPGSVARGEGALARALATPPADLARLGRERGGDLYGAFCTPCHGPTGMGDGSVVARGFPRPPPIAGRHEPAEIVRIISRGQGRMWPMAERVTPLESWAIAAHVAGLPRAGKEGEP